MDELEKVMAQYPELTFYFEDMPHGQRGLLIEDEVTLNRKVANKEKIQWMMEELGHYKTSVGNISDYSSIENMKQEVKARRWGMTHLIPKSSIDYFRKHKYDDDFEVADEMGVQVRYLREAGEIYKLKEN